MQRKLLRLALLTALFLFIATSRISRLNTREMDVDEVWSIWQTLGTPAQIINWTPYDWTPASYLILGGWRSLVGLHPFVVHLLSVYVFLLAAALFYRVAYKLYGGSAALLGTLAFSALGYTVFLSTLVRGYIFLLALTPLGLWLALAYFERPRWPRALALAVCLAGMFYIHIVGAFAIVMIGLYVTALYPRQVLRWILPAVLTVILAAPGFLSRQGLAFNAARISIVAQHPLPPLPDTLVSLFADYTSDAGLVWALLLIIAAVALLARRRMWQGVGALAIWIIAPIALYFVYPLTGTFGAKHYPWVMVGIALWAGWGLAVLIDFLRRQRLGAWVAAAVWAGSVIAFATLMFQPIPDRFAIPGPPLVANFSFLAKNIRAGDVVLIDPNCHAASAEEWDYFTRAYFPDGLQLVQNPAGYRRVWYVTTEGSRDPTIDSAVQTGRIARQFVGPWNFLMRLYEGPPDAAGVLFTNGLRFHGADIMEGDNILSGTLARRKGETIRLRLWWSVDQPVKLDYSVSTQILSDQDKALIAQFDGAPQVVDQPHETSRWTPGQFYVEERDLTLPDSVGGVYGIYMTVYQSWDGKRIAAPGTDADSLLRLKTLTIKAF